MCAVKFAFFLAEGKDGEGRSDRRERQNTSHIKHIKEQREKHEFKLQHAAEEQRCQKTAVQACDGRRSGRNMLVLAWEPLNV